MNWIEFSIHTTQEAVEPVSNILHESGASGVVIEDSSDVDRKWDGAEDEIFDLSKEDYPEEGVIVKSYFPDNTFLTETVEEVKKSIADLRLHHIDLGNNKVTLTEIQEEDWAHAWKQYYKPVKITDTLTISPTWEDYVQDSAEEHVIELDPGMAFGTGTHPSTVLSLQALEQAMTGQEQVIDVGTGSGVLAIGAAKFNAANVLALDLDQTAVDVARQNVLYNKTEDKITVRQNNLLDQEAHQADIIVANILADIIIRVTPNAYQSLKPGGLFITSGIISGKQDEVKQALTQENFIIKETMEMEDWVAIVAQK
ncbi:50S ribosomal protein L11 methyltransferase [Salibacterium salarium]|uniref:Ribosomal protein L11 methyltransferase n=1 Tax=Salibacterium salarium TaxID=284579 RepID=A0A3R9P6T9_9BACI|nr:50S ribosomal protein L11 methyltransferase [Salibacterium salarium]RSL31528.1 50S ribosomal protein L11 methyltransferase [Salibacterium salarium]